VRPVWFKCAVVATPFFALVLDIGSWYFTKLYQPFAWVVIGGGTLMGLAFAFMWAVSLYQLWFSPTPAPVIQRGTPNADRLTEHPGDVTFGTHHDRP